MTTTEHPVINGLDVDNPLPRNVKVTATNLDTRHVLTWIVPANQKTFLSMPEGRYEVAASAVVEDQDTIHILGDLEIDRILHVNGAPKSDVQRERPKSMAERLREMVNED